eukprot:scaffold9618_cov41-Cyclotella_meneghiniana.AAC.1
MVMAMLQVKAVLFMKPSWVKWKHKKIGCKDSYFYDATEMITEHFGKYIPKVYEEDTDADKNRLQKICQLQTSLVRMSANMCTILLDSSGARHFVSKQSEIEAVNSTLPDGLADLVDNRSVYGVLKYPDFQLYSLVAQLEYCYSKLAIPQNLSKYGGIVLQSICNEMARHDVLFEHFESLFRENEFEFDVIDKAFSDTTSKCFPIFVCVIYAENTTVR